MINILHVIVYCCFVVEIVLCFVLLDSWIHSQKSQRMDRMATYRRRSTDSYLEEIRKENSDNWFIGDKQAD